MHHSDNPNNFRNQKYLDECTENRWDIGRSVCRYASYRDKLVNELTMSEEQKKELAKLDNGVAKNIIWMYKYITDSGIIDNDPSLKRLDEKLNKTNK